MFSYFKYTFLSSWGDKNFLANFLITYVQKIIQIENAQLNKVLPSEHTHETTT